VSLTFFEIQAQVQELPTFAGDDLHANKMEQRFSTMVSIFSIIDFSCTIIVAALDVTNESQ